MKKKILLILALLMTITGCASKQNSSSQEVEEKQTLDTIPEYKYSDDFFNYNWSSDEDGNSYFEAGMYFYKVDKNNQLHKLFNRLIDNKYMIEDIKYYNGKFYCLVLKSNYDYGDTAPLGLATIDKDGNNFRYLNDLQESNKSFLPKRIVNFRIANDNIYFLDLYGDEPAIYIYSLEKETIISHNDIDINEERLNFYKKYFSEFPYDNITHIRNNNFYQIIFSKENRNNVEFVEYNPLNNNEKRYDVSRYFDSSDQKIGLFYIDYANDHWFLFSSKGVFMFDSNFENEKQLLDESFYSHIN